MLWLDKNKISDLIPLANLTQLTTIHFIIRSATPLNNLTQLITLWLDKNIISDIKPLENLTQLTTLGIELNQISDIVDKVIPFGN